MIFQPEIWHLLFGVAGTLLGLWLRNQNATIPDELAQALGKLHDEFQKSRALALLNDLVQGAAQARKS